MDQFDAGAFLKQFSVQVRWSSDTACSHTKLARFGFGVGDKLGHGVGRNRWIDDQDACVATKTCDRGDVADEIETEIAVYCRVPGVR